MIFGLFGGKKEEKTEAGKYDHLGPQALAEIAKWQKAIGKGWQMTVKSPNFDRTEFKMQVKLFVEKMERELRDGNYPLLYALVERKQVNGDEILFETMKRAVVSISELKLFSTFESIGRKV